MIPVAQQANVFKQRAKKEIGLLLGLLFIGLVVMPIATFIVGEQLFGAYGGRGYSDFFGTLSGKIRTGDLVAWFLILSPYLAWQTVRLTALGWQLAGHHGDQTRS
jgi:hypothetical protein